MNLKFNKELAKVIVNPVDELVVRKVFSFWQTWIYLCYDRLFKVFKDREKNYYLTKESKENTKGRNKGLRDT